MMPSQKIGFFAAFSFFSLAIYTNTVHSADDSPETTFQKEWREWCDSTKRELKDLLVFDARAECPDAQADIDGLDFVEFESIRIPYVIDERPEIAINQVREGEASLRISYESGLRIVAAPMMRNPIRNVFERLMPEVTEGIEDYVVAKYGSLEGFTASSFGRSADFVHLRFEGHKFTTEDIDCSLENIDETLRKIPMIMASASADYSAIQTGEDAAYWSKNKVPGVVTRQQTQFSRGGQGPRVIWSGEFIEQDEIWQVIISFGVEHQDQYDRLGLLLANPSSE